MSGQPSAGSRQQVAVSQSLSRGSRRAQRRRLLLCADAVWLMLLAVYVLAGTALVPFHGDESTLLMMSRDYHDIFLRGDLEQVVYHDPPLNAERQHLRLLNGMLSPYLIGLSWHLAGYSVDDLNSQWDWGADWNWNVTDGHMPSAGLLLAARWPLAILTALSAPVLFVLALRLGGRRAAYPASLLLAFHPAVLINGRRAMFEGDLLFFSLLAVTLAVVWGGRLRRGLPQGMIGIHRAISVAVVLGMGLAAGLAVASKHTGVVPAAAGYLAICAAIFWKTRGGARRRELLRLALSGLLAVGVFLALNPAWWSDPLARARAVLDLRIQLTEGQGERYAQSVYEDWGERLVGMIAQLSTAPTAYYEAEGFAEPLASTIAAYEASPWTGVRYGVNALTALLGIGVLLLAATGIVRLIRAVWAGNAAALAVILWAGLTVLTILATIPLAWQRYYLPLYPVEALLAGVALGKVQMVSSS